MTPLFLFFSWSRWGFFFGNGANFAPLVALFFIYIVGFDNIICQKYEIRSYVRTIYDHFWFEFRSGRTTLVRISLRWVALQRCEFRSGGGLISYIRCRIRQYVLSKIFFKYEICVWSSRSNFTSKTSFGSNFVSGVPDRISFQRPV